jgi:hypothetical protein
VGASDLTFTILGIDKASPAFRSVGDAAEDAGRRVDSAGKTSIKAMAGTTAASVAMGLAAGASIAAVPLMFGAMAAAALSSNAEVSDSFGNLADNVVSDVKAMTAPLADDMVGAANDLGRAWTDILPGMRAVFADPAMGKGVREMSTGIGDLARNAMPGFLTAVQRSGPVMTGFKNLLGDTGRGLSDFFTNVSESSEDTGVVVTGFGSIIRTTMADLGSIVSSASSAVAPEMGKISELFDKTTGSAAGLAEGGLPILTSAVGATVGVLNSALGVLEPISSQLGTGVGMALAAAGGWKVLTGAGNKFTELDLGGRLERTALSAGVLTEGLTGSAGAGEKVASAGSKVGQVLNKVGAALPLVGAGAVLLGLAMEAAGQGMQNAIERGNGLGVSLIKGGKDAETARSKLAELTEENGRLATRMTELSALVSSPEGHAYREELGRTRTQLNENNGTLDAAKKKYEEIRATLGGADLAQVKYNEAVAKHGETSIEAAAAGVAWRKALDDERQKQDAASRATQTHTEKLIEQQTAMLGSVGAGLNYEASLLAVETAQKAASEALTTYGADSMQGREAVLAYEQSILAAVSAIGEKTAAETTSLSPSEQSRAVAAAQAGEILRLADAAGNNAPAALLRMVAGLDATTLASLGVTATVNETGQTVLNLPGGKTIVLQGNNDDAMAKIREVEAKELAGKTLWITAVMRNDSKVAADFGVGGSARGGHLDGGELQRVGEEGEELFLEDDPGSIIPHTQTRAIERARQLALAGLGGGGGGGGGGGNHYHLTVINAGNREIDLRNQFEYLQLQAMPERG